VLEDGPRVAAEVLEADALEVHHGRVLRDGPPAEQRARGGQPAGGARGPAGGAAPGGRSGPGGGRGAGDGAGGGGRGRCRRRRRRGSVRGRGPGGGEVSAPLEEELEVLDEELDDGVDGAAVDGEEAGDVEVAHLLEVDGAALLVDAVVPVRVQVPGGLHPRELPVERLVGAVLAAPADKVGEHGLGLGDVVLARAQVPEHLEARRHVPRRPLPQVPPDQPRVVRLAHQPRQEVALRAPGVAPLVAGRLRRALARQAGLDAAAHVVLRSGAAAGRLLRAPRAGGIRVWPPAGFESGPPSAPASPGALPGDAGAGGAGRGWEGWERAGGARDPREDARGGACGARDPPSRYGRGGDGECARSAATASDTRPCIVLLCGQYRPRSPRAPLRPPGAPSPAAPPGVLPVCPGGSPRETAGKASGGAGGGPRPRMADGAPVMRPLPRPPLAVLPRPPAPSSRKVGLAPPSWRANRPRLERSRQLSTPIGTSLP